MCARRTLRTIDFVFYRRYRNDLLLVYEVSGSETSGGTIVRLDSSSLQAKWHLNLPAFNLLPDRQRILPALRLEVGERKEEHKAKCTVA